jgi:hypothetical protein
MEYLDFDLRIGARSGRSHPIYVESPAVGIVQGTMQPFKPLALDNDLKAVKIALLESDDGRGSNRSVPTLVEQPVRDLGRRLFAGLFTGDVKSAYEIARARANDKGQGLRVRLSIDDPALMTLPWEFLFDPGPEEYLCLSRGLALVRYLGVQQPPMPLLVSPPLHILGLVASPSDPSLPELDVVHEKELVENAFRHLTARNLVSLRWVDGQTVDDLADAMRTDQWNVFHFVGHGDFEPARDEGGIYLADRSNRAHRLGATQLGRILAGRKQLRLVVLNACEGARGSARGVFSSTAATLVRRGVPAVVAMQFKINDSAAVEFAREFYAHLADGAPVDAAVTEARIHMDVGIANTVEWGSPVLYMQSPDGALFNRSASIQPDEHSPVEATHVAARVDVVSGSKTAPMPTAPAPPSRRVSRRLVIGGVAASGSQGWPHRCTRIGSVRASWPMRRRARPRLRSLLLPVLHSRVPGPRSRLRGLLLVHLHSPVPALRPPVAGLLLPEKRSPSARNAPRQLQAPSPFIRFLPGTQTAFAAGPTARQSPLFCTPWAALLRARTPYLAKPQVG